MLPSRIKNLTDINKEAIMRGVVVSNEDPKLEGRIALMIPKLALKFDINVQEQINFTLNNNKDIIGNSDIKTLMKDDIESINYIWARPTDKRYMIPYKGDVVYCFMEDGDPNKVYWSNQYPTLDGDVTPMDLVKNGSNKFDKKKKPFIHVFEEFKDGTILYYDENENAKRLEVKYKSGFTINMNDTSNSKNIEAKTASGHFLLLDDIGKNIIVKTASGHIADFNDKEEKINIRTKGGHNINLSDSGKQIIVKTTKGNTMLMNDNGDCITIQVAGGAKILITKTSILLQSTGIGRLLVHPGGVNGN